MSVSPRLRRCAMVGRALTALFVIAYLSILVSVALTSVFSAVKLAVGSAIAFLLVSFVRRLIAQKRPYQDDVDSPGPREGENDSFPSRHAFSAFYIATVAFRIAAPLSYLLLAAAVLLAALRVTIGAHYPRDVVAGAFIGTALAIVTLVIL